MKQSTFSAVMANSIKNLWQGYTKSVRFVAVLTFLFTVGIGQVWGETATFTEWSYSSGRITGGTLSGAPTGATASLTTTYTNANQMIKNTSQTLTLSGFDGCTITGVTVHVRTNAKGGNGSGTLTINGISKGSLSSTGTIGDSYTDKSFSVTSTVVETGKTIVVTLTAGANSFYCDSYTITYDAPTGGDSGNGGDSNCLTLSATNNYPFNSTSSSNTSTYSTEISGVTYESYGGYKYTTNSISYLSFNRSLSGAYIANTTAFSGNIESIVVDYYSGGSSYFNMYEGSASKPSSTVVSPSKTGTGSVTYTFSGNNPYFKLALKTTGTYCNINSITICYSNTPTLSYTVTATSNNNDYGTVSVSGTTITATPKTGYRVSTSNPYEVTEGTATVVDNGDNTFTVTPESDCTVQINFESKGCIDKGASSITSGTLIGDDYGPLHAYYKYSTSQILYTKSDLDLATGKKGSIKSIYFEYAGSSEMDARTINIYMANTNLSSLSTSSYVPYSSFSLVYEGSFSCSSAGWYEITLDTPFEYSGIGNLAVMVDDNTNSYQDDKNFKYHSADGAQIYKRQDNADIDPENWTPAYAIDYRPNAKFCIQEVDMTPVTVTLMDNGATITEDLAGEGVTLPPRDGCDGYTFAGWTKSWNDPQTSWTTTAPTIIPAGSYTPTANESLYPVYTKTEGGTPVPATLTASYTSNSGWTATECGGSSYWVLKNGASITSPVISDLSTVTSITFNVRTYGGDTYKTVNVSTSGGTSIGSASASSTTLTLKTINVSPKLSGSGSIVFSSTTTSSSYGPGINEITINYSTGGSTTYYISVPDCTTETVVTLNPNGGEISEDGWELVDGLYKQTTTESNIILPTITKGNWTFAGWDEDEDGEGDYGGEASIELNGTAVILSALWECSTLPEPTGLKAIPTSDGGIISWNQVTNATGYEISTDGGETWGLFINGGSTTSHTLKNRECETTIEWQVRAVGNMGNGYCEENPAASYSFTTLECGCPSYSFHYGIEGQSDWEIKCFEQAGADDPKYILPELFTMPNTGTHNYYVGYQGNFYNDNLGYIGQSKSENVGLQYMRLTQPMANGGEVYLGTDAVGATGTVVIYDNSQDNNLAGSFDPSGYGIKVGDTWNAFSLPDPNSPTVWETTDILTMPATDTEYQTGIATAASYVPVSNSSSKALNTMAVSSKEQGKKVIWFVPNNNWNTDNARYAVYFFVKVNGTTKEKWVSMTKIGNNLYKCLVPTDNAYEQMIFCRMNPGSATNSWDTKWNQSGDLDIPGGLATKYTLNSNTQWDGFTDNLWSVHTPPSQGQQGKYRMWSDNASSNFSAHWIPWYVLTYDKNATDATGSTEVTAISSEAASYSVTTNSCGFTRTGYDFVNWQTQPNGGTAYSAGATYTLSADATLYAQWQAKNITITWDANGGSVTPTSSTYTYNGATITPPTPTRANYIFNGWFTAATGGTKITEVGTNNKPTEDVTYYAQWTEKANPTFAWSAATCTAALEADNTFPTLSNPNNLSVTYKSSDENVAKIDVNGNVILGAVGTTTITADGAETATHKSATTTYELIVVESNCKWVEVEIGDIDENDQVVIAMAKTDGTKTWALDNSETGTYPAAGALLVEGNKISQPLDKYIWNIVATPEGYVLYSYADKTTWLYCTGSNNTVKVGTGSDKKFVIENGYLKCSNQLTVSGQLVDAYIGVSSNTNSWRHYPNTTGVIKDQTLKFYKRECLDSEHYWVTWDAGEGTWEDKSSKKLESYQVGATITAPTENPTREGYRFDGWTPTPETMPAQNTTFTAVWTQMHTITWMVGSNSVLTEEVANTTGVTQTPGDDIADDAIGDCANAFMGWTETPLGSAEGQSAPADLCTAEEMKAKYTSVNSDKTFYAVFATASSGGGENTEQVFATTDIVSSTGVTTGYKISAQASKEDGYYQDGSGDIRYVQVMKSDVSTPMIANIPISITVTANLGGGSTKDPLTNSVYAIWLDAEGNELGDAVLLTNKITAKTGSDFTANLPIANATSAYGVRVYHQKESSYNVRYYAISLSYKYNDVTYSNYVTQCCTDWTPTLTYSKTTLDASTNETATPTITGNTHSAPVSFESSNTSVLTVDANGTITAVGAGKATITATWAKKDDYCEKSITTDEITVNGKFLVTFHANDGSGNTTTQQIASNTATALNANTFQRDGYTFQGWATSASGAKVYDDGQEVTLSTSGLDLYAVWQVKAYKITVGTITGNGTITTSPANSANCDAQVTITATPAAHYTLASVTVTRDDNSQTVAVVGNKFTMPASDVTITAVFTENEKFAINYDIPTGGGTLTDNAPTTIYIDGSITLPGIKDGTISSEYECEEFIGWTTLPSYESYEGAMPTPFYKAGDELSGITEATTLRPVYKRNGDGPSGTVELTCTDVATWKSDVLSGNNNSYGTVITRTATDGSAWTTNGMIQNAGGISLKENYYIQIPTLPGPMTTITMKVSQGNISSGEDACSENVASPTSRAFHFRSAADGSNLFTSIAVVEASRSRTIEITEGNYTTGYIINGEGTSHVHAITVAYGSPNIISTYLNCSNDIDEFTITYNTNYGSARGQIPTGTVVNGACDNSGEPIRFEDLPNGEYTICNSLTATQYKLVGWNSQANGNGGLSYEPGDVITMVPQSDITLYAQWVPEVIMLDNKDRTITYQETVGEAITLPAGAYTCDGKYTFVGWTTDNVDSWNQKITKPTLVAELDGNDETLFVPTEPTVVYAVYKLESTANSKAFYLKSGDYYAQKHDTYVLKGTSDIADATRLYRQQINVESPNNYWLYYLDDEQQKRFVYINTANLGSLFIPSTGDGETTPADTEGWEFVSVTGGYKLKALGNYDGSTQYMRTADSGNMGSNTSGSVYTIETATEINYYAYPTCSDEITITFETRGGTLIPNDYPYVLTKKEGDVITLPGCEYAGLDFIGWVDEPIEPTEIIANPEDIYEAEEEYVVGNQNIVLYAYYSQTPESAEYDGNSDGEWKIYAFADGEYHFAVAPDSEEGEMSTVTICDKSTTWTFTNVAENQYYIQDEAGRYVGVRPAIEDKNDLRFTDEPVIWTIESKGSDLYRLTCETNTDRVMLYDNGRIRYSSHTQEEKPGYFYVTIGGCFNPIYTTDPARLQAVSVYGTVQITSTLGQTVKAMDKLTLVVRHAEPESYIRFSSPNVTFYDESGNVITTALVESQKQQIPLVVAYTPDVADNSIARPAITVTAKTLNPSTGTYVETNYSVNGRISARSLPADFVIAAKTGNSWVALTANITSTGTQAAPLIMVDNIALPTKATITPNTTKYQLLGLQTDKPSIANSRFKNNGAAIHLYSTNVSKVISASTSTDNNKTYINADAAHEGAANSSNCLFYEWQLQTNDLVHYTLVNSNTTNTFNTKLGYSATYAQWGMYQTGNNVIQEVLFLPIEDEITEMDVEVMEWGTNSMALRFGSEAPATVDITLGATTTKGLSLANLNSGNTSDIYKVEGLSLAGNDCEALLITDANDALKGKLIRKPILVSGDKKGSDYTSAPTRDVCMHSDIVILNGGKLTADEAKSVGSHVDFANIYVYPGGKLVLDGNSLGVKRQVYLRGGYSWLNSTYALPEVYVNGDINFNGSGKMIYDYYIQNQKYYQFALPYNVQLAKVTDESGADDFPVWVKHYNGALRAADAYATSWEWYPSENGDANAYFEAGIGYIIAAKPRQVGNVANRPLSIIRFPLGNSAFTGGEGNKSVVTTAHGIDGYKAGTVTANNVGWNFIGNPFMATWKGDIGHKELAKHPDEDNWDGSYHWVDSDVKFITIMSPEDGSDYAQTRADVADLKPFFPFYIQETADGGSGTINFAAANRVKKAPALWNVEQDEREAYIQIEIAMDAVADQTGVFVSNKYSDEIDFDDYEKMFGSSTDKPKVWLVHDHTRLAFEAMTENRATGMTPLGYRAPQDGEYMLVLNDEVSQLNNVESIYLTDYETGVTDYDLTLSTYEFESTTTLYNDTRFAIRVVMRDNTQGSVTAVDNVGTGDEQIHKFIYQDKIYILHHGVIYDATGKRVITINK